MCGIRPRPGGSGTFTDFVGRGRTTAWSVEQWRRGQNLLLSDPRRMGKTDWLQALPHLQSEFVVVYIDYEGVETTEAFLLRTVARLIENGVLRKSIRDRLSALFDGLDGEVSAFGIRLKAGVRAAPHTRLLEQTVRSVEDTVKRPVLIEMDELPTAVINIARKEGTGSARALLETLRAARLSTVRIRWVVCGSVGMHHALREAHTTAGVINDLQTIDFGPLDADSAGELARRLFKGIHAAADAQAAAALADTTDKIPYFMHAVAARLEVAQAGRPIDRRTVMDTVDAYIHDRDDSRSVDHLLNRVDEYYGDLTDAAYRLLDETAIGNGWTNVGPGTDNRLLDMLVDDHYLLEHAGGGLRWRYPFLQRIWVARRRLA